jgi:UDP-glucuronate 4-epimerase
MVALIEKACGRAALRRFKPPQPGDVPVTYASISRARKEIGYDPRTPIEQGVARFVDWYRRPADTEEGTNGGRPTPVRNALPGVPPP